MGPMHHLPPHATDLGELRAAAFALLAEGVVNRRAAAHSPTLATVGLDGAPRLRTLVLRGFDPQRRELRLHSDARSGKLAELAREPRAELHVYDAPARIQIRLRGTASLHRDDAVAEAAWAATPGFSRAIYGADPAPGLPILEPLPAPEAGDRANFAVLLLRFEALEWLFLAAGGHRRARITWSGGEEAATWLAP
jgi:hypothetical protein